MDMCSWASLIVCTAGLVGYKIPIDPQSVSHDALLEKLKVYGFDDSSLKWMKSFLKDRTQYVQVAEKKSEIKVTNIGTPQGSRLSPILFLCLMADDSECMRKTFQAATTNT